MITRDALEIKDTSGTELDVQESALLFGRLGFPEDIISELREISIRNKFKFVIREQCGVRQLGGGETYKLLDRLDLDYTATKVTIKARRGKCAITILDRDYVVTVYGSSFGHCRGPRPNLYAILSALSQLIKRPNIVAVNTWIYTFEVPFVRVTPTCPQIEELIIEALRKVEWDYCGRGPRKF